MLIRFESPVAPAIWEGVADAVTAPAACPQPPSSPITPLEVKRMSEDCLYLNIYAPDNMVSTQSLLHLQNTIYTSNTAAK